VGLQVVLKTLGCQACTERSLYCRLAGSCCAVFLVLYPEYFY